MGQAEGGCHPTGSPPPFAVLFLRAEARDTGRAMSQENVELLRRFAMSRQHGRGASSGAGAGAELELANIFTLHDGVIVRTDIYRDRDEALEAAGLSE